MNVSRETRERLEHYVAQLLKWNKRINLVSKSTVEQVWDRHILDSLQVFDLVDDPKDWTDIGSGGGLPGLVVAVCALEKFPEMHTTLIESDQRKSAFCRSIARDLSLNVSIKTERIEAADPQGAHILSARALAPLDMLLSFTERHRAPDGTALFLKGQNWQAEVNESLASWSFKFEKIVSKTEPSAVILKIGEIQRVQ